jgi:hypothetical protein
LEAYSNSIFSDFPNEKNHVSGQFRFTKNPVWRQIHILLSGPLGERARLVRRVPCPIRLPEEHSIGRDSDSDSVPLSRLALSRRPHLNQGHARVQEEGEQVVQG